MQAQNVNDCYHTRDRNVGSCFIGVIDAGTSGVVAEIDGINATNRQMP